MITDTVIYETLMEVMDQVERLDKKVTRLLSAAGLQDVPPVPVSHGDSRDVGG